MKQFIAEMRGAIMSTLMLAIVCCGLYPLLVFGIGQAIFRDKANGSLIVDASGTVRGSRLLGQHSPLTNTSTLVLLPRAMVMTRPVLGQ